jgi:DNA mismatch repair ATPase MutS
MKAYLMYRGRDVDLEAPLPEQAGALERDLELATLLDAMARGDAYLRELAERALLTSLEDSEAIRYRQRILADCLRQPAILRQLYALAVEGVETRQRGRFFWFRDSADGMLHKSLAMLAMLFEVLRRLRTLAETRASDVESEGFRRLFASLREELDDAYLAGVESHLQELSFKRGALISARLGPGNRGTSYTLRKPREQSLLERLTPGGPRSYSFMIPARDEHGARALGELRARGIHDAASVLAQSTDHVLSFFTMLRAELGFYVGCLNLHEQLTARGEPTCLPEPAPVGEESFAARGLYDAERAFHLESRVVGSDVAADGKRLLIVTGANQGGKSTFLRSAGLAQLMLQAGMFVAAESFRASVCRGVFTHFKREEDPTMESGKLDEELGRMSEIADRIRGGGLLLCNESFSSTNEREGSEIARTVIRAMLDSGVRVIFVTHQFDLAHGLHEQRLETAGFLRAERLPDGRRTFRILEGAPEPTSHGKDSYRRVFGATPQPAER